MAILSIIRVFFSTFPTATILYILLVLFTELNFDLGWFIFAVVIDLIDDIILGKVV